MESTLAYVIVFGLIILFTWIFISNKEKKKKFSLGKKYYSFGYIEVQVEKKSGKNHSILLNIFLKNDIKLDKPNLILENIDSKGNGVILKSSVNDILDNHLKLDNNNTFIIDFPVFLDFFIKNGWEGNYFRFALNINNLHMMKTVILSFNKKGMLFVPDSGRYN